jgi:hypothetical protein
LGEHAAAVRERLAETALGRSLPRTTVTAIVLAARPD